MSRKATTAPDQTHDRKERCHVVPSAACAILVTLSSSRRLPTPFRLLHAIMRYQGRPGYNRVIGALDKAALRRQSSVDHCRVGEQKSDGHQRGCAQIERSDLGVKRNQAG